MKNRLLLIAALLPLFSFSYTQEEIRDKVTGCYRYYYSDNHSIMISHFTGKLPAVENHLKLNDIAIETTTSYVWYPDFSDISYSSTNLYASETAVRCIEVNTTKYASLNTFPSLYVIYNFATSLYAAGYRGSGFKLFQEVSATRAKFNFNYSLAVADISASTNVVFRQILLSHLSSISADINSIGASVNSINSDYQQFNYLALNPDYAAFANRQASPSTSNGGPSQSSNLQLLLDPNDPRSYERSRALAELSRDNLKAVVSAIDDPSSEFYGRDINTVLSNPDMFQRAIQAGGGGGSVASIARDIKKLSTNDWVSAVTNDLANNRASITNQLSQNTEDIKNELLHIFEDNDPSTTGRAIRDIAGNASTLASAVQNNRVVVTVENTTPVSVLLDGPVNIDQSQLTQLSTPLAGLQSRIDTWYQDWYSFYTPNVAGHSWADFFDLFSAFKLQNHSDISSLTNFFGFSSLSSSFSSLLHDDYSNFVEHSYSDILFNLENQYPEVYEDLVNLGLDDDSYSGRWWTLQSSSLAYLAAACRSNNTMIASVVGDLLAVRSALESYSEGRSPLSLFSDVASSIPSQSKIEDFLNQATNAVNSIGSAGEGTLFAFSAYSNTASRAFSIFNDSYSLPDSITLLKLPNEHYITVPVGSSPNVWRVMRWGISLGLVCVNIILFPKFFFYIVTLFMRLFRRSVKILPSERSFD